MPRPPRPSKGVFIMADPENLLSPNKSIECPLELGSDGAPYLNLCTEPLESLEPRICPDDKDPKEKLQAQPPTHSPPGHLQSNTGQEREDAVNAGSQGQSRRSRGITSRPG